MTVTIYHNPKCSKSRAALALIRKAGTEPEIIEYLKNPPSPWEIKKLQKLLDLPSPRHLMRTGEATYKEQDLGHPDKSADDLIAAMAAHPVLIERPIVVTPKGAAIGRPPEKILGLL